MVNVPKPEVLLEGLWLSIYILRPVLGYLDIRCPETPETGCPSIRPDTSSSAEVLAVVQPRPGNRNPGLRLRAWSLRSAEAMGGCYTFPS